MNIVGVGIDLVELAQFEASLDSPSFIKKVYTDAEQAYCNGKKSRLISFAGKFAVKECVMKVLGAGIYQGVWFAQIEVLNTETGKPHIQLHRTAKIYSDRLAIMSWHISITHTDTTAAAVALAIGS